jgi:hypothetical protein
VIPAVLAAGVIGLLAIVGNSIAETRIVTVRTQTTAARDTPPVAPRVAVHHPPVGRHRR